MSANYEKKYSNPDVHKTYERLLYDLESGRQNNIQDLEL